MSAPRVSRKLQGGPKGAPRGRTRGPNEIDPMNIGSLTLNRDAIQALTIAQAKVQVTISGGGTTAVLLSEETGKQIGGLEDLAKLLGLRSFVSKEKKLSASSDVQQEVLTAAFRASASLKQDDSSFVQKKLDNAFVLAAKPYKTLAATVCGHLASIKENYHDGSAEWRELIRFYGKGILNANAQVLRAMVGGEKEKGLMEVFLRDEGVPAYVRNKLQLKSLAVAKDGDMSRLLFPQDPAKGLAFTVAEWRDEKFLQKQKLVLSNSDALLRIFKNDELFLELIGMSHEEYQNVEDPRVQRINKMRILVVPPFEDHKRVLEPLSRQNFRGFGLPATAMDQSKDRLSNLCAVFVRAYAFSVRMAETIPEFFDQVLPAGSVKKPDGKLGNYAKQVLDTLETGAGCSLLDKIKLKQSSKPVMAWICRECKIDPNGTLAKSILNALKEQGGFTAAVEQLYPVGKPEAKPIHVDLVTPISTGSEKDSFKTFKADALSLTEKSAKGRKTVASSVLSRGAKSFLKQVAKDHSPMLAQSMEGYFRGFYSAEIQAAAVKIAEARFDDLDELSELDPESDDSSSDDDDSADEAEK